MFARVTRFVFDAADQERFRDLSRRFLVMFNEQPGFQSVVWAEGPGESLVFSIWDTREHAEAVTGALRDKALAALEEASIRLSRPPETTIYEVVDIR